MLSSVASVSGSPLIPVELRPHILYTPGLLQDTVTNSANSIGCTEAQVAKSIVVEPSFGTSNANKRGSPNAPSSPDSQEDSSLMDPFLDKGIPPVFLFVLAGSTKINLRKVHRTLAPLYGSSKGTPAPPTSFKLLSRDQVLERTGYPPGAVGPLGLTPDKVAVYLDISLRHAVEEAERKRESLKQSGVAVCSGAQEGGCKEPFSSVDYQNFTVPVYEKRDRTAEPLLFCSAGTLDTAVQLSLKEMERWSNFIEWVDVGSTSVGSENSLSLCSPLGETSTGPSSPNAARGLFPPELLAKAQQLPQSLSSSEGYSLSDKAKQLQCSLAQIVQCVMMQVAVSGNKNHPTSPSASPPLPTIVFVAAGGTKIVQKKVNKVLAASISAKDSSQKYSGSYKIIPEEKWSQLTGLPSGVVTPVGLPSGEFEVYLDNSLKEEMKEHVDGDNVDGEQRRQEQVLLYIMGETPGSMIGVTVEELEKYSGAVQWVDVFIPQ